MSNKVRATGRKEYNLPWRGKLFLEPNPTGRLHNKIFTELTFGDNPCIAISDSLKGLDLEDECNFDLVRITIPEKMQLVPNPYQQSILDPKTFINVHASGFQGNYSAQLVYLPTNANFDFGDRTRAYHVCEENEDSLAVIPDPEFGLGGAGCSSPMYAKSTGGKSQEKGIVFYLKDRIAKNPKTFRKNVDAYFVPTLASNGDLLWIMIPRTKRKSDWQNLRNINPAIVSRIGFRQRSALFDCWGMQVLKAKHVANTYG